MITDLLASKPGCGPASSCEPYRELIAQELERGRNAMGIWQDLVDSHGFTGGYQSVRRFVRNVRGAATAEVRAIIETPAGEECQVDYGTGPMVRDPDSGKYRRTRLFVLTLGEKAGQTEVTLKKRTFTPRERRSEGVQLFSEEAAGAGVVYGDASAGGRSLHSRTH